MNIILYILFALGTLAACFFAALAGVYVGTKYNELSEEDANK